MAGISSDKARELNKLIKGLNLKGIQSQAEGDQLRVNGKKRDHLQAVIAALKEADPAFLAPSSTTSGTDPRHHAARRCHAVCRRPVATPWLQPRGATADSPPRRRAIRSSIGGWVVNSLENCTFCPFPTGWRCRRRPGPGPRWRAPCEFHGRASRAPGPRVRRCPSMRAAERSASYSRAAG